MWRRSLGICRCVKRLLTAEAVQGAALEFTAMVKVDGAKRLILRKLITVGYFNSLGPIFVPLISNKFVDGCFHRVFVMVLSV